MIGVEVAEPKVILPEVSKRTLPEPWTVKGPWTVVVANWAKPVIITSPVILAPPD